MANSAYIGAGTSLGTSYYLRRFYSTHTDARTTTSRNQLSNSTLSSADAHALRSAIKALGSFTYNDDNATNIRNNVSAFVSTYNNLLDSSGDSSDRSIKTAQKNLKNITAEYEKELDKLGISIKDDGTLETRSTLFSSASISKFQSLFSNESQYMQRVTACAKRIQNKSSTLEQTERNNALAKKTSQQQTTAAQTDSTAASFFAAMTSSAISQENDLNTLLHTGIGKHVNLIL